MLGKEEAQHRRDLEELQATHRRLLEEPVTTPLRRLVATFEPQIARPPKIDQVEGSSTEAGPPDGDPTIP